MIGNISLSVIRSWDPPMAFELRPYQVDGVEALCAAFRAGKQAPLLQLPTGAGKTICFCFLALNSARKGNRICILVHRQELLQQTSRALESLGVAHGIIAPGYSATDDPVQVASVQTLVRRIAKGDRRATGFDLLVIDEAHHSTAGSWCKVITAMPKARILGVTATPCRLDGKGLGTVFDELVLGPSIRELIDLGFLVPSVVYAPPVVADLKDVRVTGGDFRVGDLAMAMDKPTITGDAVDHYRRICPGVPAIAFCTSIEHARHVAAEFSAAGFRAESIDGNMADGQRKNLIQALGDGRVQVLTSCDIVSEGTDIPIVGAAILLRPTKSEGLFLQQVGRALRPAPGKRHAIILDHVGNVLRHGMPDEEREWSLEGGAGKRKGNSCPNEPTVRQRPSCYAAHRPASRCPICGHEYEASARGIEFAPGELKQIDPKALTMQRDAEKLRKKAEVANARSRDQLLEVARKYGHNPRWVDHVLDARARYRGGVAV
ncbi:MAG: DEAD/DEAH box helicase [Alphaproteobacteria bacterium]|nr:DEAD/DEAH box helicase [Alphaproteobacteria bacterium]